MGTGVLCWGCRLGFGDIGIDIEKIRVMPDMHDIVERHFTHNEKQEILSCLEKSRLELFYKLWTRKEAVLKAQGEGLLKALECVDVATNKNANGPWKVQVQITEGPNVFNSAVGNFKVNRNIPV